MRDNGGDTVCYEYTSIRLQNPDSQQARPTLSLNLFALSVSIWAHQYGEPGLFPAPKLTDSCLEPSMSSSEFSVNPAEAELAFFPENTGENAPWGLQGYLTYTKTHPPRTLPQAHA